MSAEGTPESPKYSKKQELARGKTKIIWETDDSDLVIMENLNSIGAQDGGKTDHIEGKAESSTTITANVFRYLKSQGITTHFREQISPKEILTEKCDMVPLECVFRFVTTGSHYKREQSLKGKEAALDGTVLATPLMEFFYKHDVYEDGVRIADPLMQCKDSIPELDERGNFILLHPANGTRLNYSEVYRAGTQEKLSPEERKKDTETILHHAQAIQSQTVLVGQKLKEFYKDADIEVLDGKIEFGVNTKGELVVADVIDADSCRLRKPTILENEQGQRCLGKDFSREQVKDLLQNKYISPIDNFFEFVGLMTKDSAPYTDTLQIIEKFCVSEPGKFKETLKDFIRDDGKIDFEAFRQEVVSSGEFRGTRRVTRALLQDIARKKAEEFIINFDVEGIFERGEHGKIVFERQGYNDAIRILQSVIGGLKEYVPGNYTRIVEGEGYDKQGYREGEELNTTRNKYEKLAEITTRLLKKLDIQATSDEVSDAVKGIVADK